MCTTDILNLNKSQMFEKIRDGLPAERNRTMNLLECKDELLYAWDSVESSLLVINWRAAQLKGFEEVKFQSLIPSTPQSFQIERILASTEGSLIALAGPHGVTVLELPRRWGQNGLFMEGKDKITCRSTNLDAHFFNNNPHLEVQQIRWHPASPSDSHLLVLISNNSLRVYDNSKLRHVWQVGPPPTQMESKIICSTTLPSACALGETAVDFDIAPPNAITERKKHDHHHQDVDNVSKIFSKIDFNETSYLQNNTNNNNNTKATKIEWPILILRENGNIYILLAGIDTEKPRLQGPITMQPHTDDNYGLDSCSILVIPSLPPTLVIAETSGKLHHALLLPAETAEESFNEVDLSLMIHPSEWILHVVETVELELGLPKKETSNSVNHNCLIHLKRDLINELRYFAYHDTGLHVITVNFIDELLRYLETDVTSDCAILSNPSRAEYIICTKIDNSEKVNAILGFVLMQMPSGIVVLLGSGQVLSLKLVIDTKLLLMTPNGNSNKQKTSNDYQLQMANINEPSFVEHIQNILKRTVTQPIISLDKSLEPSAQDSYELLTQAMEVLRSQYIKKHEQVRIEFIKRLNTIKLRKEQQKQDIEFLELEREQIRENAHRLAERFEEISDHQELLSKKCQDLVRQANISLPNNTIAEQEFRQEVEKVNKTTKQMSNNLQKSRETLNKQMYHISKYKGSSRSKSFELPQKQETTIKEILLQLTAEIDDQIKEVKRINSVVNI